MKRVVTLIAVFATLLGIVLCANFRAEGHQSSNIQEARIVKEQEQALMAGVALGFESISSEKSLIELRSRVAHTLPIEILERISNILLVDKEGRIIDNLDPKYNPEDKGNGTVNYRHLQDILLPLLVGDLSDKVKTGQNRKALKSPIEPRALSLEVKTRQGPLHIIVAIR
jgi:hypothetical protein